jgi:hypothetical protein
MSAPDDSYRTAPTWELIDDLLQSARGLQKGQDGIAGLHWGNPRAPENWFVRLGSFAA